MSNFVEGERHTPAKDLANVGLLIYRTDRKKNLELLVRYNESENPRVFSIPNRAPRPGETALDTAKRVGIDSLGREVPEDSLDYSRSAIIENPAFTAKIRVFMVKATPQLEELTKIGHWRGWEYTFIPLISFQDRVWLQYDIGATALSLTLLLKD
ncbi:hypothetical protein F4801DRAFT_581689 [Xylaria longipes]|nr:hypothetical protein F4801DRAFT_581689 [Xylaria longipes]RYC65025.1 hypothetical protein CHU98_g1217 [Xylaria longipes]